MKPVLQPPATRLETVDLSVQVGPLRFRNPVIAASGTFGYGTEFDAYFDLEEIGGFVTQGLSLKPLVRSGKVTTPICTSAP